MANFDLTNLAIQALCPTNEILYDDKNRPSIMVKLAKKTYAQLGLGESTDVFPAWIVNGQEVDYIWISKYQNIVQDSRAYSLPGKAPRINITLDNAIGACAAKGAGWHVMTALEWGALIRMCAQAGITPIGNNNYGKHNTETIYTGIPVTFENDGKTRHIGTGTGPLTYSHDGTISGIWDLCGNVWEWTGGIRTVYGEVQILADNNAADTSHSQAVSGTEWKAIKASDGTLITPDGSGTTEGSVKMDFISSKITYSTGITTKADAQKSCNFSALTCDATISDAAKTLLIALGLMPASATAEFQYGQTCYMNNGQAERCFYRGGRYDLSSNGFPSFNANYPRSSSGTYFGFRSAYVVLPSGS